jgi:hypothetical protein
VGAEEEDDPSLFDFLTNEVSAIDGLTHVEAAPVMRAIKLHATMNPPKS